MELFGEPLSDDVELLVRVAGRWRLDRATDRWVGHDYPGALGNGFVGYETDELELGARAACSIDDPDQTFWELEQLRIAEGGRV